MTEVLDGLMAIGIPALLGLLMLYLLFEAIRTGGQYLRKRIGQMRTGPKVRTAKQTRTGYRRHGQPTASASGGHPINPLQSRPEEMQVQLRQHTVFTTLQSLIEDLPDRAGGNCPGRKALAVDLARELLRALLDETYNLVNNNGEALAQDRRFLGTPVRKYRQDFVANTKAAWRRLNPPEAVYIFFKTQMDKPFDRFGDTCDNLHSSSFFATNMQRISAILSVAMTAGELLTLFILYAAEDVDTPLTGQQYKGYNLLSPAGMDNTRLYRRQQSSAQIQVEGELDQAMVDRLLREQKEQDSG